MFSDLKRAGEPCHLETWTQGSEEGSWKSAYMGKELAGCLSYPPALASFGIIARRKRLGGCVGFLLPVKAREGRVNGGVRRLVTMKFFEVGGCSC